MYIYICLCAHTSSLFTTQKTIIQGVTNKRDWDSFVRSKERFRVHDFFQSNKVECFNMWLDSGKSWDEAALQVERLHKVKNESARSLDQSQT